MEPNAIPRDMNTCAAALNQTCDKAHLKIKSCPPGQMCAVEKGPTLFLLSHLHFKEFVPDWGHKIQDAVWGSRKLHIIDEQSQQDEVGKYCCEVHNLQNTTVFRALVNIPDEFEMASMIITLPVDLMPLTKHKNMMTQPRRRQPKSSQRRPPGSSMPLVFSRTLWLKWNKRSSPRTISKVIFINKTATIQDSSLKELLAGGLQLSVVAAEESHGAVFNHIPGVVAGRPWEGRSKRGEHIEKGPTQDHVVVRGKNEGDDNRGQTSACKRDAYVSKCWETPGKEEIISHL